MAMANEYDFEVQAVNPSGLLQYQGGKASSVRTFSVTCRNAEEFALRQLGKFYDAVGAQTSLVPELPAIFPADESATLSSGLGRLNMVAVSFTIEPIGPCCFHGAGDGSINDPTEISEMETYWFPTEEVDSLGSPCRCLVTITYEEPPWSCQWDDRGQSDLNPGTTDLFGILAHTAIFVDRNAAYELFTLPSRALEWAPIPGGPVLPALERRLKDDSYAYTIVPKADVTLSWYNVQVSKLCLIEEHLASYRGFVNQFSIDSLFFCGYAGSESGPVGCDLYPAETMLFVDWEEDHTQRTTAFKNRTVAGDVIDMNTTTLKLMFKQKNVIDPFEPTKVKGWNHLYFDRGADDSTSPIWRRVLRQAGTGTDSLFPLKDFDLLLNPAV